MPVTLEQVRAALQPEEPSYEAAARLGAEALPHLRLLAMGDDQMLASKAIYLAGRIGGDAAVRLIWEAAGSQSSILRVAAAGAARYLPGPSASDVLLPLVADRDAGVRKVALGSVGREASPKLRSSIEELSRNDPNPQIRRLSRETARKLRTRPDR